MSNRRTPQPSTLLDNDDPPSRLTPAPEVVGAGHRTVIDAPMTSLPPVEPLPAPSTVPTSSHLGLGDVTSATSPAVRDVRDLLPVFEGVDLPMLTAVVTLVAIGMVMVMTASSHFGIQTESSVWAYGIKQAVGIGLGLFVGVIVMLLPYRWLRLAPVPFYVLTLVVLGLVQSPMGVVVKGARRWLDLGPLRLQPSEIAKLSISLLLARHFNLNRGRADDFWGVLVPVGVWLAPAAGLVLLQRDLGQTMLLLGITGVAIIVGGTPLRWITAFLGIVSSFVLLAIALEPYRVTRVLNFLDPLSTADAEGLQVAQGWVAIAVGGPWGVGLGNGVAQQGFLPEAHTDMILAVIGEETGVFGMLAVLVLELVVIARGMGVAARAHDMFEMVAAACITAYLGAQVIINVAVVGGFAPPKGLVLPFVSYGASAMIFNIIAVACLLRMGLEGHRARVKEQACSGERSRSSTSSGSAASG